MGFFSSSKGHDNEPRQKLNVYNVLILLALAPGSICYGYTAAIIATTLGMSNDGAQLLVHSTNIKPGQPSFSEYFGLATRSNANALIGAMNGLFFTGGTLGPLILPMITDRKGRRWGIAIVSDFAQICDFAHSSSAIRFEHHLRRLYGRQHQRWRIHILPLCGRSQCIHDSGCHPREY